MILLLSLVFSIIATAAGLLAADRMQVIVPVSSGASVSELALPIGHWAAVGLWALSMLWLAPANRRQVIFRCIGVGFALHALILVALFVPRLSDRAAFSATVYLLYARAFCVMAIALSTAWLFGWVERMRTNSRGLVTLEAALVAGWVALLIAAVGYTVLMAVAGLAIGIMIAVAIRMARTASLDRTAAMIRTMATDERAFLVAVFLVALGMRLLYVARIMSDANYLDAGADGRVYDELAWSIASGQGIPRWFSDRFPLLLLGHVWLAAGIYAIAGHSYVALTAVQSVLGAGTCVLLYDIARRLFGRPVATVSAIFAAVSFPLVFAAATIGHQAVDVFMTALIVWMLTRLMMTSGGWRWAIVGAMVGFAFAVRETNIFFAAFLVPWIAYTHPGGWRGSGPVLAAFSVGAVLVVLPFLAPKVWSADARQGMRGHFDRMYRGEGGSRPTSRTELIGPLDQPRAALAQLRDEPVRVISTLAREYADNFAAQFLTQPYGGFDLVFLRKGSDYYYGMWFYAYALTVVGTIVVLSRIAAGGLYASGAILIVGLIVTRTLPHLILASDYRHRAPLEPFLILLASVAAVAIGREVIATAANTRTSGFTGSDWRVSQSSGT